MTGVLLAVTWGITTDAASTTGGVSVDPVTAAVREDLVVRWGVEDDLANLVEIDLPGLVDAVCLVVDQAVAINGESA